MPGGEAEQQKAMCPSTRAQPMENRTLPGEGLLSCVANVDVNLSVVLISAISPGLNSFILDPEMPCRGQLWAKIGQDLADT